MTGRRGTRLPCIGQCTLRRADPHQVAIPRLERGPVRGQPVEAAGHQVVPADIGQPAPGLPAAHHQPVLGPGQRDVEQAIMLLQAAAGEVIAEALHGDAAELLARGKQRHRDARQRVLGPYDRSFIGRNRRGVGQDDQRRLQPLGAVHRHHPDLVAGGFRLALHLGTGAAQPVQEALQRGRVQAGIGQGGVQQLVHRLGRLRPQPREQPGAAAERPQCLGEQGVGRDIVGARQQGGEEVPGALPVRAFMGAGTQRLEQGTGAVH